MPASDHFMPIPPRHRRALELLMDQKKHDPYGAIGTGALRDEDDPFTLEQIAGPLLERGLIEDLTNTDFGRGARYFIHITPLGEVCLGLGYMLRDPRRTSEAEIRKYLASDSDEQTKLANVLHPPAPPTEAFEAIGHLQRQTEALTGADPRVLAVKKRGDSNEEKEAIA